MNEMRLITTDMMAQDVPRRWGDVYQQLPDEGVWAPHHEIGRQLNSAKELTAEIVAKIIGNNSWTRIPCIACERDVVEAVMLHKSTGDYEDQDIPLCFDCVKLAYEQAKGEKDAES